MKFIDECKIEIKAGKGGNGVVSFRREAKVPRGGPDGGDGGDGGSIYFVGDKGVNTLLNVKYMHRIKGRDGENGRNKNQYGARGEDFLIKVPLGTLVYNEDQLLEDVVAEKPYLIAKGGKGGRGNVKFKSSKNTAPRLSENGLPGQILKLHLVLKVLADVGFVGKPSSGKSTLLSQISNAKPKIADYDFTTLTPQLGIVKVDNNSFVAADLPGLIAGAAEGKGLGHDFLKHIERCRVIAHVIDFGSSEKNPLQDYQQIRKELESYSWSLEKRSEVIVANKQDLDAFESNFKKFQNQYPDKIIMPISALTREGLEKLKYQLYQTLQSALIEENLSEDQGDEVTINLDDEDEVKILKPSDHVFEVIGPKVQKLVDLIPLNTPENLNRFNNLLKGLGVWDLLRDRKIQGGDLVKVYGYEFEWADFDD